jgi:hypothetical protein
MTTADSVRDDEPVVRLTETRMTGASPAAPVGSFGHRNIQGWRGIGRTVLGHEYGSNRLDVGAPGVAG